MMKNLLNEFFHEHGWRKFMLHVFLLASFTLVSNIGYGQIFETFSVGDSYLYSEEPDTNYGSEADQHLIKTDTSEKLIVFQFDISTYVGQGLGSVAFKHYASIHNSAPTDVDISFSYDIYGLMGADWDASTVTWNTKPEATTGKLLTNTLTNEAGTNIGGAWFELSGDALTNFVAEALAKGEESITLIARASNATTFRSWISGNEWRDASLLLDYDARPPVYESLSAGDAWVYSEMPDTNYGSEADQQLIKTDTSQKWNIFEFDLSGMTGPAGNVSFRHYASIHNSAPTDVDVSFTYEVFGAPGSDWDASTVTWNTKPESTTGALLSNTMTNEAGTNIGGSWYELSADAFTNFVNEAYARGEESVTLFIKAKNVTTFRAWTSGNEWRDASLLFDYNARPPVYESLSAGDAWVYSEMADTNYGSEADQQLIKTDTSQKWNVFEFDLTGMIAPAGVVSFRHYASIHNSAPTDVDVSFTYEVFGSTDTDWDASTVTWNTKPEATTGALLSNTMMNEAGTNISGSWYELSSDPLTNYINEAYARGEESVTLIIKAKNVTAFRAWTSGNEWRDASLLFDYNARPPVYETLSAGDAWLYSEMEDTNYGSEADQQLIKTDTSEKWNIFQFDLSGMISSAGVVSFRHYASIHNSAPTDVDVSFTYEVFGAMGADWSDDAVTWANKPDATTGALLSNTMMNEAGTNIGGSWYELSSDAFTNFINEAYARGESSVTLFIKAKNVTSFRAWTSGNEWRDASLLFDYNARPPVSQPFSVGDAWVYSFEPDANFGSEADQHLHKTDTTDKWNVFKFNIGGMIGLANEVKFRHYASIHNSAPTDVDTEFGYNVLASSDNDWDASTVTWNTKPEATTGTLLSNTLENAAGNNISGAWYELTSDAFTSYINEAYLRGEEEVTLVVVPKAVTAFRAWTSGNEWRDASLLIDPKFESSEITNDTLFVLDDVHVSQAEPDVNFVDHGNDLPLINDFDSLNADKQILMKFPLVNEFGAPVGGAVGQATILLGRANVKADRAGTDAPAGTEFKLSVFGLPVGDWDESTVTWNNQPDSLSSKLLDYTIVATTSSSSRELTSDGLTNYINSAIERGDEEVSFVLKGADETDFRAWVSDKGWRGASLLLNRDVQKKFVLDDAFVREDLPDSVSDGITAMAVAYDTTGNSFEAFIKFNAEGLSPEMTIASLMLRASQEGGRTTRAEGYEVEVFGVDTDWSETSLTWNNRPDRDSDKLTSRVIMPGSSQTYQFTSTELTDYVKDKVGKARETVSFAIVGSTPFPDGNVWVASKEWFSNRPRLETDNRSIAQSPIITPEPGFYVDSVVVMMETETPEASIYYTTDGTDPSDASTLYVAGELILKDSAVVKAITIKDDFVSSEIVEVAYDVAPIGLITFDKNPSLTYKNEVTVFLSVNPEDVTIRFSTDGSDPVGGTTYNNDDGILINTEGETTIQAVAIKDINDPDSYVSPVFSASYTVVVPVEGIGSGPGGVGAGIFVQDQPLNVIWLAGDQVSGVANGAEVSEWSDVSGNDNHALHRLPGDEALAAGEPVPNTGEKYKEAPLYIEDGLNGKPILDFGAGANDANTSRGMVIADDDDLDNTAGMSLFVVFKKKALRPFSVIMSKRDIRGEFSPEMRAWNLENNGGDAPDALQFVVNRETFVRNDIKYNPDIWHITSAQLNPTHQFASLRTNGIIEKLNAYNKAIRNSHANVLLGGFVDMDVAEVIMYKDGLNEAQNTIVHNYLSGKYGIALSTTGLENGPEADVTLYDNAAYTNDIIGIGEELGLDAETVEGHYASSGGSLELVGTAANIETGEYVFAGHDGGDITETVWSRKWFVKPVGDAVVTMGFNFRANNFDNPNASEWVLEYNAGDNPVILDVDPTLDADNGVLNFEVAPAEGTYRLVNVNALDPAATPTFSVAAGTYQDPISVEIASGTPNATIYYTTDGTDPTDESTEYSTAIDVVVSSTIKAIASAQGFSNSAIAEAAYVIETIPNGIDQLGNALVVYPNPVEDIVTVELPTGLFNVKVTDMSGREILSGNGNKGLDLDLSGLESGTYLIRIESDGKQSVRRLIKK